MAYFSNIYVNIIMLSLAKPQKSSDFQQLSERPKNHTRVQGRVSFNATLGDECNIGKINHK
jgi:hypothetical protein